MAKIIATSKMHMCYMWKNLPDTNNSLFDSWQVSGRDGHYPNVTIVNVKISIITFFLELYLQFHSRWYFMIIKSETKLYVCGNNVYKN